MLSLFILSLFFFDDQNKARPFIAWAHSHTLRCVRFTPSGNGIIVGAANGSYGIPSSQTQNHVRERARERTNGRLSFGAHNYGYLTDGLSHTTSVAVYPSVFIAVRRRVCACTLQMENVEILCLLCSRDRVKQAVAPNPQLESFFLPPQSTSVTGLKQGAASTGGGAGAASEASAPSAPPPPPLAEVTFRLQVWDFSLEAALSEVIASAMTRVRVLYMLGFSFCMFSVSCVFFQDANSVVGRCGPF